MVNDEVIAITFFIIYMTLGAIHDKLFIKSKNLAFKKKYFITGTVILSGFFASFTTYIVFMKIHGDFYIWLFFILVLSLITYLNIRNTKFCESCGSTIRKVFPFERNNYCEICGNKLCDNDEDDGGEKE